ncbi:helix-turn-helix domain-containing protein [Propionivibrio limicola]|uniref:helix-turn-helix domain-containing protein n=1 Tax=Propionivibrio limicola TaxID=167645 RepID=UPI00129152A5|nr:helix-turn-helix domain-containing protein [Propionivibrio limicola]
MRTPDDFNIYGIVVDRDELARYAAEVEAIEPEILLGQSNVLLVDVDAKKRLCQRITHLLDEASHLEPRPIDNTEDFQQITQDRILGALVSVLMTRSGENAPERHAQTRLHRWQTVRRIREYITENADAGVNVPELCRQFHMSRRTLQYSFEEVTGLSPTAYIRNIRLNGARRELRRLQRGDRSVSEIALDGGFSHFGQFSQDYRQLFAELPSATLRSVAG